MTVSWQSIQDCKLQQCNTHAILAPGAQTVKAPPLDLHCEAHILLGRSREFW